MVSRDESAMERLHGPLARLVLSVTERALLGPLGVERLLVGVRTPDGRLSIVTHGASDGPTGFSWSGAAPFISALRRAEAGCGGSIVWTGDRWIYRYGAAVEGSEEVVVVAAVMTGQPTGLPGLHAAVGSAVYSILAESDASIPEASIVVSVASKDRGYEVSVARAGEHGYEPVIRSAPTVEVATAECAAVLAETDLVVRFADQKAVAGVPVSIVVADWPGVGLVIGASENATPSAVSPAIAVFKASNACRRLTAERASAPAPVTMATPG